MKQFFQLKTIWTPISLLLVLLLVFVSLFPYRQIFSLISSQIGVVNNACLCQVRLCCLRWWCAGRRGWDLRGPWLCACRTAPTRCLRWASRSTPATQSPAPPHPGTTSCCPQPPRSTPWPLRWTTFSELTRTRPRTLPVSCETIDDLQWQFIINMCLTILLFITFVFSFCCKLTTKQTLPYESFRNTSNHKMPALTHTEYTSPLGVHFYSGFLYIEG